MASHQEASSSNRFNSNSTRTTCKYDIFLSFRGEDTRKGFTDHLYQALQRSGFTVFRDDEELGRGEVISDKLIQAIEDSHCAIVVLSKHYAFSSWCIVELKHILDSRRTLGQKVFPIFYDVDPSNVRHQRKSFAKAFARHQMLQKDNKVMESWRKSLKEVSNLSGWDCKDWHEGDLINTVVEELRTQLQDRLSSDSEELIGMDDKVKELEPLLEIDAKDVRFVGIWGLPGVGKTTIARAVFDKYRSQFEISCFLHNVSKAASERDGDVQLQNKLLSNLKIRNLEVKDTYDGKKNIQNIFCNKKVLLILDDVSHTSHLEILANRPDWFGAGSRVIITTRNCGLLRRVHEVNVHEVQIMNTDESLQLFSQKAFGSHKPQEDLLELSKAVCDYAKGLPLVLSVLGSSFCRKNSVREWEDALDNLKKAPDKDIFPILKLSFDALTETEQGIFLDIACFFDGWSEEVVTHILESCGFNAKIGIANLREKSLLKEYDGCLVMHDLLEQMGRQIVAKSSDLVGERSRLWSKEDIDAVMVNNLGTKKIQGMVSSTSCEVCCWHPEAFSTLHNLRLLMVSSRDFNLPHGLKCLSHALKVLHWTYCPLETLPSETRLSKLVDLQMRHSKLRKLGNNTLCSEDLKFLDLSYSKNLIETPDFSELPNLERLELEGCEDLVDLHSSIGQHKKLQVLNLKCCTRLRARCPKKLEMTALKEFVLFGCIQVKCLPDFGERMKNLEMLDAGETNLVKLPESLGLLSGLKTLKLRDCKNLVCFPQSVIKLKCLVLVDIGGCSKFDRLPEKLNELEALEEIDASETDITEIPSSIGGLKNVEILSFRGRKRSTTSYWSSIPLLNHTFLGHSTHKSLTLPASMFNLKSLRKLDLSYNSIGDGSIPYSVSGLSSLERLDLTGNLFENLPTGFISERLELRSLCLNSCPKLRSLPQSGPNLRSVDARGCGSLETVGDEQLLHLFASMHLNIALNVHFEVLRVIIPGSEIPSWFENQKDLCLDGNRLVDGVIDIPLGDEDILGIGVCLRVDDKFDDFGFAEVIQRGITRAISNFPVRWPWNLKGMRLCDEEIKSSNLWILFWKPEDPASTRVTLRLRGNAGNLTCRCDTKICEHSTVSITCAWRLLRKSDFENCDYSMNHSLLPASEQHIDQGETSQTTTRECETMPSGTSALCSEDEVKLDESWKQFIADDSRFWF